jgi:hypothetical protein
MIVRLAGGSSQGFGLGMRLVDAIRRVFLSRRFSFGVQVAAVFTVCFGASLAHRHFVVVVFAPAGCCAVPDVACPVDCFEWE